MQTFYKRSEPNSSRAVRLLRKFMPEVRRSQQGPGVTTVEGIRCHGRDVSLCMVSKGLDHAFVGVSALFPPDKIRRIFAVCCVGLLVSVCGGCTIIGGVGTLIRNNDSCTDFMVGYRNSALAAKAWHREKHLHHGRPFLKDFRAGFVAGYLDVADGGNGCLPAYCPREYWGWQYQSSVGQQACDAWFAGFPLGAKAAEEDGVAHWGHISMGAGTHRHATSADGEMPVPEAVGEGEQATPDWLEGIQLGPPANGAEEISPGARGLPGATPDSAADGAEPLPSPIDGVFNPLSIGDPQTEGRSKAGDRISGGSSPGWEGADFGLEGQRNGLSPGDLGLGGIAESSEVVESSEASAATYRFD